MIMMMINDTADWQSAQAITIIERIIQFRSACIISLILEAKSWRPIFTNISINSCQEAEGDTRSTHNFNISRKRSFADL